MQETPVRLLGWEDPLEKGQATHSSILGLPWWLSWERICLQLGRPGFDPWVGKILLEKGKATHASILGLPWLLSWERLCLQRGRPGFDPWVGKVP